MTDLEPEDNYDDGPDEDEDAWMDDCRMAADGLCSLVGTEWCDWQCPLGASARLRKRQSAIIGPRLTPPEE